MAKQKDMFDMKPGKMFKLAKGMVGVAIGAAAIGIGLGFVGGSGGG